MIILKFSLLYLIPVCVVFLPSSIAATNESTHVVYDQRQTGKYNIHLSIKDVAIIEMERNEFQDDTINDADDYYYDDDELTIKPISAWLTQISQVSSSTTAPSATSSKKPQLTSVLAEESLNNHQSANSTPSEESNHRPIPIPINSVPSTLPTNITVSSSPSTSSTESNFRNNSTTTTTKIVPFETNSTMQPLIDATLFAVQSRHSQANMNIPLEIIMEPVLHPKQRSTHLKTPPQSQFPGVFRAVPKRFRSEVGMLPQRSSNLDADSKVFKFKSRRVPQSSMYGRNRRCRSGQFLDKDGNCRIKRSSSFLKKLFNMLVSLPLNDHLDDDHDE